MKYFNRKQELISDEEKIIKWSDAHGNPQQFGQSVPEDFLPDELRIAKRTLFSEGTKGEEFLAEFMGCYYIAIENHFTNKTELDFSSDPLFAYKSEYDPVSEKEAALTYNKAVRNSLAFSIMKEFRNTILVIDKMFFEDKNKFDICVTFLYPATGNKVELSGITCILDNYLYQMSVKCYNVSVFLEENSTQCIYRCKIPQHLTDEDLKRVFTFENRLMEEYGGYHDCEPNDIKKRSDKLMNHIQKKYRWGIENFIPDVEINI